MGKLVSVIIPAYRVGQYIERCLDSILKQSYSNIEIIVVFNDDNSSDNTLNLLQKYKNKIKLINVGRKTSPAIARNIGLAYIKGEYVTFCDGDDFIAPEKIVNQVTTLNGYSDVGLVYTDFIVVDAFGREHKRVQVPKWNRQRWFREKFDIPLPSIMLKKGVLDIVEENGSYFDESLLACEDFDLLIRLSKITEFMRVPSFLTYYTRHKGQLSGDVIKTIIMETKILMKHGLYAEIIPMTSFELVKMMLTKTFENPMVGFGLFFKEKSSNKLAS